MKTDTKILNNILVNKTQLIYKKKTAPRSNTIYFEKCKADSIFENHSGDRVWGNGVAG